MSAEHELVLNELQEFRAQAFALCGRLQELPPEPDQSATAGGDGLQVRVNNALPSGIDGRAILANALRDVMTAIDSYLSTAER